VEGYGWPTRGAGAVAMDDLFGKRGTTVTQLVTQDEEGRLP
jgi:hypothetical protein